MEANVGFSPREVKGILSAMQPRLGFGCGELYGGRHRRQSVRIIEGALDQGVVYFDTARLYGHGEAEHILGEVVPRHRSTMVLASKAGILPTTIPAARKVEAKARQLLRRLPGLSRLVDAPRIFEPEFGVFDPQRLRLSVETSLRALRTDHLDILLLHECTASDATHPDVQALLHGLRDEGKIRFWGTATDADTTRSLARAGRPEIPLLQFRDSVWEPNAPDIAALTQSAVVTHSVFGRSFRNFVERLGSDETLRARISKIGVDPGDIAVFARLLLADALSRNQDGIVLFSTSKAEHLKSNLKAATVEPELAAAFASLAR
jgi:aryl-alcohol dehydrogenase-like predicted oxidoreductase